MSNYMFPDDWTLETLDAHLADLREERQRRDQNMADCRYDLDDCFVSAWANNLNSDQYRILRGLVENGGRGTFQWLANLEGEPLPMKHIDTRFGGCIALIGPDGKFCQFVNYGLKDKTLAKKGLQWIDLELPAVVTIAGSGSGLAGAMSCHAVSIPDWRDPQVCRLTGRKEPQ